MTLHPDQLGETLQQQGSNRSLSRRSIAGIGSHRGHRTDRPANALSPYRSLPVRIEAALDLPGPAPSKVQMRCDRSRSLGSAKATKLYRAIIPSLCPVEDRATTGSKAQ